jgi:hypothetical protein
VRGETQVLLGSLAGAEADVARPARLVERLVAVLPRIAGQLDARADAFAVGHLGEVGAGIGGAEGVEILYVRGRGPHPARLRLSRTRGLTARLSVGVTRRAYGRCFYGPPDAIASAVTRQGLELGYLAAVQVCTAHAPEGGPTVHGWTASIGMAVGAGVPVVQESSVFSLTEEPLVSVLLDAAQVAAIEGALAGAHDRSLLRAVATGHLAPRDATGDAPGD